MFIIFLFQFFKELYLFIYIQLNLFSHLITDQHSDCINHRIESGNTTFSIFDRLVWISMHMVTVFCIHIMQIFELILQIFVSLHITQIFELKLPRKWQVFLCLIQLNIYKFFGKTIFSVFYSISPPNVAILLILRSFF